MKTFKNLSLPVLTALAASSFLLGTGCVATGGYYADAPAPVPVPDEYVWDGYEYVGMTGDQYYYLGPGQVWVVCEPYRVERFHGWEREHGDWHSHAIHNDHYRNARIDQRRPEQRVDGEDRRSVQPAVNDRRDDHRESQQRDQQPAKNVHQDNQRHESQGNQKRDRDDHPAAAKESHEHDNGQSDGKERHD